MTTARTDFRFFERLRVRWVEVDMQQIVFNAHYLMYFDTAVAGYWRALAMPYHDTMSYLGGDLYARKATVEYVASARYDDQIEVGVRTQRVGNSSMVLACAVFRGEQLLVSGELVYVFADPDSGIEPAEGVEVIRMPDHIEPLQEPLVYTVPLQLLAYHTAVLRGTDVDQPRNLAKSVTVE